MQNVPVAIVGVSALFPGSTDAHGFWRDILSGRDMVTDVPASHWLIDDYYDPNPSAPDKTYCKRGAFLPKVDFDPMEFGIPPNIIRATDTVQLLALIVAQQVLDDATRGQFASMNREKVSVILGCTSAQELMLEMTSRLQRPLWLKGLREAGIPEKEAQDACDRIANNYTPWQEATFPGLLGNVVAGRIANRFDLRGTNAVCDAACASTLSALSMALNELYMGQSDLAIAGGVDTMNDIAMFMCFSKTPALSKTGDCRPFSDKADGTLIGEGLGMIALKRLADAERDGDHVYAVVKGLGSASDGRGPSVYAPLAAGQARALRRTYEAAGYGADTVELVEAHGTGTMAGDAAEVDGLKIAFGESGRKDAQWCALGSVKSQIGHTKAAAGAAGLFKAVMALHHKALPPTIKVDRPNPKMKIETSPFYLNTKARPWIRGSDHPRRASVSAFGFGGSNFHVTLEEYAGANAASRFRTAPSELFLITGKDGAEVATQAAAVVVDAEARGFAAIARISQASFDAKAAARLAIVANDLADLRAKLDQVKAKLAEGRPFATPTGTTFGTGASSGTIGFLFPGQGSQYLDMGADVAMAYGIARQAWDHAATVTFDGKAVHELAFPRSVFDDPSREAQTRALTATEWAQPAIGVASVALLGLMTAIGVKPAAVGGHSFGEVTALCAAGALDEAALLRVARERGERMRDASAVPGAMIAVARPIEEVRALVAKYGEDVVVANHNHPTQVVLSGATAAIEAFEKKATAEGIAAKRLPVATAFHSPLVAPSSKPFAKFLDGVALASPTIPVWSNAEAAAYPADPQQIRARLAEQIARPVRFVEQIEGMYAAGVRTFVEVGPGSVLTELVDRILGKQPHEAIALDRKGKNGLTALNEALGRLAAAGIAMNLAALWSEYGNVAPKTRKKAAMTMAIDGANYGKPYPPPGGTAALPKPNPDRAPVAAIAVPQSSKPQAAPMSDRPSPPPSQAQLAWVHAYQEAQRNTAEAHAAYQRAMAESHMTFLRTVETSFTGLSAMLGAPVAPSAGAFASLPTPTFAAANYAPPAPSFAAATYAPPAPAPVAYAAPAPVPAPAPVAYAAPAPVPARAPAPAPVAAPRAAAALDLEALMMGIVAEKTGYPSEMLGLQMELEGDLGIDSIKRVEILSTMRERAPSLPEVDAGEMGKLRTLGEIVDYMRSRMPAAAAPAPAAAPAAKAAPKAAAAPSIDLEGLMMAVVAEKTGYPSEMLGLHMELEGDLGIDSIKRVEILSTMRERAPSLPEVDAGEMGKLRTLGEIVDYMRGQSGAAAHSAPTQPAPAASSTASAPASAGAAAAIDLEGLMMAVVAEKTGYPAEMLGLHMELEGDLGIDSIKRVEILSTMRERAPSLPEVDASEMGKLRTLGEIVNYMRGQSGSPAPIAAPAAGGAAPVEEHGVQRFVTRAEPAPAIGLAMSGLTAGGRVVVTEDGSDLAGLVVRRLGEHGVTAEIVAQVPDDADVVVFLGGMSAVNSEDAALAINRDAFHAARAVAKRFSDHGGAFVTVQDTDGDFGISGAEAPVRAWLAGVSAVARTAAIEWPKASVKALDIEAGGRPNDAVAADIVDELLRGGPTREVGRRANGDRITVRTVAERVSGPAIASVNAKSVIVASGGGRGVTAACLIELARRHKPRIVVLGRTALTDEPACCAGIADDAGLKRALLVDAQSSGKKVSPAEIGASVSRITANREIRATLDAIRKAGGDARYVPTDVQDGKALSAALTAVRTEWGPITGIVHGAGVLADKKIAEKTDDQFDRVFDTKVKGLQALLAATAGDPLKFVCLFSSVAARSGNNGQVDYAAANEILNKVGATLRRARGIPVKAIGWGPWEGGMVTPALAAHFKQMGVALIPLAVGARMFVDEITGAADVTETIVGGEVGEGALGASTEPSASAEVLVDRGSHGFLVDHTIGGKPVIPMALAMEWLARIATACRPDLAFVALRDVKVLRGIKLDGYDGIGDRFVLSARQLSNGAGACVAVELRGDTGALHYSAIADLGETRPVGPRLAPAAIAGDYGGDVYDGHVLFHGAQFQVIRAIEGVSATGIAGQLVGSGAVGWGHEALVGDPAALDGGLQLVLLWARKALGAATLPMALASWTAYATGAVTGPVRAVVAGRATSDAKAVCDVAFIGQDGTAIAEFRGIEIVSRPGEKRDHPALGA